MFGRFFIVRGGNSTMNAKPESKVRYRVHVQNGNYPEGKRTRIVVIDSKPDQCRGLEVIALRLEPNGQWITEGAIDQSQKGSALFIAAAMDEHTGKAFTGIAVPFPFDFLEAVQLSRCIAEAYELIGSIRNECA